MGFSIELSVANQVLGQTGGTLKPQFLNYLANIEQRAGQGPIVRIGGNTQDSSTLFLDQFEGDKIIEKAVSGPDRFGNAINTPVINFSVDLLYAMANISGLTGTEWYFGLAFNETATSTGIGNQAMVAEYSQRILGDKLLGLIVGNEPDL